MKTYTYILDKTSKKFHCPECEKKRFVLYVDTSTGKYLAEQYGRCDREANCGYWLKPEAPADERRPLRTVAPSKKVFVPTDIYRRSRRSFQENSFVAHLLTLFDEGTVADLIRMYGIGTSKYFPGACVFWFIDPFENIIAGQVKPFDNTGHTIKNEQGEPLVTWVHSILRRQPWAKAYNQQEKKITSLFGEHLLASNPMKPVAIVEAPKTAIIATPYFPKFLWLATGALSWLTADKMKVLQGRKVVLFPDLNAYDNWRQKGDAFGFVTSDVLERIATDEERQKGLDLADFLQKIRVEDFLKPRPATRMQNSDALKLKPL